MMLDVLENGFGNRWDSLIDAICFCLAKMDLLQQLS